MTKTLTRKQQAFIEEYLVTGNATEAAARTYDVSSREAARVIGHENLTKLNTPITELLDKHGLDDKALAKKHNQLLNQKKKIVVRTDKGTKIMEDDDATTQRYALDMAYKLKGSYPNEKLDITDNKTIRVVVEEDKSLIEGEIVEDKEEVTTLIA